MAVVGLLLGVALRAVRLHRDPTPLMICSYLFAAIAAYTFTWRAVAAALLHRDVLSSYPAYLLGALLFCAGVYAGKWGVSRYLHRVKNRQTAPRLRRQMDERRRHRAAQQRKEP